MEIFRILQVSYLNLKKFSAALTACICV